MINIPEIPDPRENCLSDPKLRQIQQVELKLLRVLDAICRANGLLYWLDGGTLLGCVRHGGFIPWDDDIDVGMTRQDYEIFETCATKVLQKDVFLQTVHSDVDYPFFFPKLRDKYSDCNDMPKHGCHQGIGIDIFIYDKCPTNKLLIYLQRRLYKILVAGQYQRRRYFRRAFALLVAQLFPSSKLKQSLLNMHALTDSYVYRMGIDNSAKDEQSYSHDKLFPLQDMLFEGYSMMVPCDWHDYLAQRYGNYMELPPEECRVPTHCNLDEVQVFRPCNHPMTLEWVHR
jgi:lipopolysaccharide cholinephosphotransferase